MDCLEFRRLLGSDPRVADAAARAHLETCPRCQDAYARAQAFEARIAQAMAVAVPEGLADRILLNQLTNERQRRASGFRYGWIALAAAASLAIAVGIVRVSAPDASRAGSRRRTRERRGKADAGAAQAGSIAEVRVRSPTVASTSPRCRNIRYVPSVRSASTTPCTW